MTAFTGTKRGPVKVFDASRYYARFLKVYNKDIEAMGRMTDAQIFGYGQQIAQMLKEEAYFHGEQTAAHFAKLLFGSKTPRS